MKRKRTKSVITMILAALLCLMTVCPALGAETVEGVSTALEAAVEENTEESVVREEAATVSDESAEGQEAIEDKDDAPSWNGMRMK